MDFYINKNATLPVLKLELYQDGINNYSYFFNKLQNADIYFTMTDIKTGIKHISRKIAGLAPKTRYVGCTVEEYFLAYQFNTKDSSRPGTYLAQFTINFLDGSGTLIVPIREELYVHILDGSIKK
jgi:hypothetical protein